MVKTYTKFLKATECMSDFMRWIRRNNQSVLSARGGFDKEGVQGWTLLIKVNG